MLIEPWKAPKHRPHQKRTRQNRGKLICPKCNCEHRSIWTAADCAREVHKYGDAALRSAFAVYEERWWERHPKLKAEHDKPAK